MGCESSKSEGDDILGERKFDVVSLHGTIAKLQPICGGMTGECMDNSVHITLEIGVGGGCSSFLGVNYTIDRENNSITVYADGLEEVTPGIACTMEYGYVNKDIKIADFAPPFTITYSGTMWVTRVEDYDTWSNTQLVE